VLPPDSRSLLLDALRPPAGMVLDRAVATTFTLDLTTTLTVPLAFVGFALSATPDPIAVMEAVQVTAGRLDVFCQAGMVTAERWPSDLVALLEGVIHEVPRPRPGHLFHPKLWVVRYADADGALAYRCLVLSRNLTPDCSWDVMLRLDSDPSRNRINQGNDGLVRLIGALPALTGQRLAAERAAAVAELADELRRVWWELPDGVDEISFVPFGVPGMRKPRTGELFAGYRHLLMAPFVTAGGLELLLGDSTSTEVSVIARAEELDRLPTGALEDVSVYAINPLAGLAEPGDDTVENRVDPGRLFGAVHAKVYVVESGRRARVFVGSANATDAAFGGNVEALCQLSGSIPKLGVATMLSDDAPFRALLEEYTPPTLPAADAEADAARQLEAFLVDIAEISFVVHADEANAGWTVRITSRRPVPFPPAGLSVGLTVAPYNRAAEAAALVPGDVVFVELGARPAVELTPFLLLAGLAVVNRQRVERRVVVMASLENAPIARLEEILIRQVDTPEKFLRLLALLLGFGSGRLPTPSPDGQGLGGSWSAGVPSGIFELLVRALAVQPDAIDRLAGIVERLRTTDLGAQVLPPAWDEVWSAVSGARRLIGVEGS
jgi:hypothetical protein